MRVKAKLSRLQALNGNRQQLPVASPSELQQRLARFDPGRLADDSQSQNHKTSDEALVRQLKGYQIGEGLIQIQRRIPLYGSIGHHPLSLLRQQPVLPGDKALANRRQVYFDTETTGLSGGSGTLAFLFGFALVEQDCLAVTQYLITRFAGETAMLEAINRMIDSEDRLVSYNGKSYDLPLMNTRYRMHNISTILDRVPHLDLLHAVRRLFKTTWPDCRLITLEERLLGLRRHDDLPGSQAPDAWFSYVRAGNRSRLVRVVEHNLQDILSLAMAHGVLSRVVEHPARHDADITALARWLALSDKVAAYALLKQQRQRLPPGGKRLLGQLARRHGNWVLAVEIWEGLARSGCPSATEQLAKYHEHISKDLHNAKYYCERLPMNEAQQRRLKRIVGKLHGQEMQLALP